MLNSRLISILNVSKYFILILLLASCSSKTKTRIKSNTQARHKDKCEESSISGDERFLTVSAKHHAKVLSRCFQNFMRFEENKKQIIKTCNVLTVTKTGRVNYAYTRGYKGTILSKDLKMCMEQDFWKMQFKGLQLKKGYTIKFPVSFQSI